MMVQLEIAYEVLAVHLWQLGTVGGLCLQLSTLYGVEITEMALGILRAAEVREAEQVVVRVVVEAERIY
jgi:hypothetical protein